MPLTAQHVIDAVRDAHPAFTEQRVPDSWIRRTLARAVRLLQPTLAAVRPTALPLTTTSIPLPLAVHASGAALPEGTIRVLDVVGIAGDGATLPVVQQSPSQASQTGARGVWLEGEATSAPTLRLSGEALDWSEFVSLTARTLALPADYASNAAAIPLPDDALDALAQRIAAQAAIRLQVDGSPAVSPAAFDPVGAEQLLVLRLARQSAGETHRIVRRY